MIANIAVFILGLGLGGLVGLLAGLEFMKYFYEDNSTK